MESMDIKRRHYVFNGWCFALTWHHDDMERMVEDLNDEAAVVVADDDAEDDDAEDMDRRAVITSTLRGKGHRMRRR